MRGYDSEGLETWLPDPSGLKKSYDQRQELPRCKRKVQLHQYSVASSCRRTSVSIPLQDICGLWEVDGGEANFTPSGRPTDVDKVNSVGKHYASSRSSDAHNANEKDVIPRPAYQSDYPSELERSARSGAEHQSRVACHELPRDTTLEGIPRQLDNAL